MINYTEKGIGLHEAIARAGHTLMQVDGQWVASDDAAVQAIIDGFDPDAALPDLDRPQFAYLLALGLGDVWDEVEARARAVDREVYAELRAARERTLFRFDLTMAMIERLAPFIPPGVDLSREAVAAVWRQAAERGGVLSVEAGG